MPWARLNLPEIERALAETEAGILAQGLWRELGQEPISDDVVRRMLEGYRYVDHWLAEGIDVFAYGNSRHLLELNHRVLCGVAPERRVQFRAHIVETERHFYDETTGGGIGGFIAWYQRNRNRPPRLLAGAALVQIISVPQLFIEGNSRTATLIASYCLARSGLPPLVVVSDALADYHLLIERCMVLHRTGLSGILSVNLQSQRAAAFLDRAADPRYLLAGATSATAHPAGPGRDPTPAP